MEGDQGHHERVRRQQQAWVDRLLGPGKGLMLLQFREVVAQQQAPVRLSGAPRRATPRAANAGLPGTQHRPGAAG